VGGSVTPVSRPIPETDPVPVRVMIVEDTDHVRRMLTSMLTLDGFEVTAVAVSGQDALERIEDAHPDVIILDQKMPGMDGLTTARRIRDRYPNQVLILYTAYTDKELERQAEDAGISLCVDKVDGLASLEREITRLSATLPPGPAGS